MSIRARWQSEVAATLDEVDVLALATLVAPPPLVTEFVGFPLTQLTAPFNLAGVPAIALPVPSPGFPVPVSLQLVGPTAGEHCGPSEVPGERAPRYLQVPIRVSV
jgi:Asp-tRNA(Asn)/Glu-tRNA(Gln) amidotransferase A subunit family amidase